MAGPRSFSMVLASIALAAGCASNEGPYPGVPPTNATVTRVLMQAPSPLAAAPAPLDTAAGVAPVALETGKAADKRGRTRTDKAAQTAQAAQKAGKPAARADAPAGKAGTASATADARGSGGGRGATSAALQYRYFVELDRGGLRTFDFTDDQKLRAGDRVFVTDGGTLSVK
jgi:hypothetical protein